MDKPKLLHDIKEKQKQLLFDMNKFCDKLDEVSRELKEIKKLVIILDSRNNILIFFFSSFSWTHFKLIYIK